MALVGEATEVVGRQGMPEKMYFGCAVERERLRLASSQKYEVKEGVQLS